MIKNAIISTKIDLDIYRNVFTQSKRLRSDFDTYRELIPDIDFLSEDLFILLFKSSYVFEDIDNVSNCGYFNYLLLKDLNDDHEMKFFRNKTKLKYFFSLLSLELILKNIYENVKLLKDEIYEINKSDRINYKDEMKKNIEILSNRNFFYKVLNASYKEALQINQTINTWGLDDSKLTSNSYDEKVLVSMKLKKLKKVKNIAEMTGRFKSSANKLQKKKTKESGMVISDVTLGNEINKVLPTEKIYLSNDKTRKSFFKKYNQKELLSYKYSDNRLSSKGPIICCVDTSTSMEGELEVWSKSIAMTLLDIAYKQKRDFVAILFSYKVGQIIEFNKNKREPNKIYDLANNFFGSGTNFIEPLTASLRLLGSHKYKYSDIIFITDGEAPLDEEFIQYFLSKKKEKDFRMITVNVSNKLEPELNKINDIQLLLKDLTEESVDSVNETIFSI